MPFFQKKLLLTFIISFSFITYPAQPEHKDFIEFPCPVEDSQIILFDEHGLTHLPDGTQLTCNIGVPPLYQTVMQSYTLGTVMHNRITLKNHFGFSYFTTGGYPLSGPLEILNELCLSPEEIDSLKIYGFGVDSKSNRLCLVTMTQFAYNLSQQFQTPLRELGNIMARRRDVAEAFLAHSVGSPLVFPSAIQKVQPPQQFKNKSRDYRSRGAQKNLSNQASHAASGSAHTAQVIAVNALDFTALKDELALMKEMLTKVLEKNSDKETAQTTFPDLSKEDKSKDLPKKEKEKNVIPVIENLEEDITEAVEVIEREKKDDSASTKTAAPLKHPLTYSGIVTKATLTNAKTFPFSKKNLHAASTDCVAKHQPEPQRISILQNPEVPPKQEQTGTCQTEKPLPKNEPLKVMSKKLGIGKILKTKEEEKEIKKTEKKEREALRKREEKEAAEKNALEIAAKEEEKNKVFKEKQKKIAQTISIDSKAMTAALTQQKKLPQSELNEKRRQEAEEKRLEEEEKFKQEQEAKKPKHKKGKSKKTNTSLNESSDESTLKKAIEEADKQRAALENTGTEKSIPALEKLNIREIQKRKNVLEQAELCLRGLATPRNRKECDLLLQEASYAFNLRGKCEMAEGKVKEGINSFKECLAILIKKHPLAASSSASELIQLLHETIQPITSGVELPFIGELDHRYLGQSHAGEFDPACMIKAINICFPEDPLAVEEESIITIKKNIVSHLWKTLTHKDALARSWVKDFKTSPDQTLKEESYKKIKAYYVLTTLIVKYYEIYFPNLTDGKKKIITDIKRTQQAILDDLNSIEVDRVV